MQSEEEKNRLRVLSQQNNIPLRVNQPTQPTATPLRVSTPYIPSAPQAPQPSRLQSAESFISAAGSQLGGGLLRAGLRTAPTIARFTPVGLSSYVAGRLGGRDVIAEAQRKGEELAQQSERLQAAEMARLPDQSAIRPGKLFGSGIKAAADIGLLVAPAAATSKFIEGTNLYQKGIQGARAVRLATKAAESVVSGLPASAVDVLQQIGRGEKPSAARSLAIGAAVDLGVPFLGETVRVLRDSRILNRLAETDSAQRIFNYLRRTAPEIEEQAARTAAEDIAKTTNPEEVANIVDDLIKETPTPTPTPVPTPTPTPTPAVQAITDTLARQSDVNQIRQTVQELFPALDANGQTQFAQRIAAANTPEAVEAVLDQADEVSRGLTQAIQEATPPAVAPTERPIAQAIEQPVTAPTAVAEGPTVTQPATVAPRVAEPTAIAEAAPTGAVQGAIESLPERLVAQAEAQQQRYAPTGFLQRAKEVWDPRSSARKIDAKYAKEIENIKYGDLRAIDRLEYYLMQSAEYANQAQDFLADSNIAKVIQKYKPNTPEGNAFNTYRLFMRDLEQIADGRPAIIRDISEAEKLAFVQQFEAAYPTARQDLRAMVQDIEALQDLTAEGKDAFLDKAQLEAARTKKDGTRYQFFTPVERAMPEEVERAMVNSRNIGTLGQQRILRDFTSSNIPIDPSYNSVTDYVTTVYKQLGQSRVIKKFAERVREGVVEGAEFVQTPEDFIRIERLKANFAELKDVSESLKKEIRKTVSQVKVAKEQVKTEVAKLKTADLRQAFNIKNASKAAQDKIATAVIRGKELLAQSLEATDTDAIAAINTLSNEELLDVLDYMTRGELFYTPPAGRAKFKAAESAQARAARAAETTKSQQAAMERISKKGDNFANLVDRVSDLKMDLQVIDNNRRGIRQELIDLRTDPTTGLQTVLGRDANGIPFRIEVTPEYARLLQGFNQGQRDEMFNLVGKLQQPFRQAFTGILNPSFQVAQATWNALLTPLLSKDGVRVLSPKAVKSALESFNRNSDFQKLLRANGASAYSGTYRKLVNDTTAEAIAAQSDLFSKAKWNANPKRAWDKLGELGGKLDNAARTGAAEAAYQRVLKEGGSKEAALAEAIYARTQVLPDYSNMHKYIRGADNLLMYTGAAQVGMRVFARALRERPLQTVGKLGGIGAFMAAGSAYSLAHDNGEEFYKDMVDSKKEYILDNNIIIVLPGAKKDEKTGEWTGVIKYSLPNELRPLNKAIRSTIYSGQPGVPLKTYAMSLFDFMTGNIKDSTNPAFNVAASIATGKDPNTGREIYDQTMDNTQKRDAILRYVGTQFGVPGKLAVSDQPAKEFIDSFVNRVYGAKGSTEATRYFQNQDKAIEKTGLNRNELEAYYGTVAPRSKDLTGNSIKDKTYYDSASRATTYLRYPKTFEVSKEIDRLAREQGKPGDPLFDLPADRLQMILNMQANFSPGNYEDQAIKRLNPWIDDFNKQRSEYFDKVLSEEQKKAGGVDPMGVSIPKASPELSSKLNQLNKLTTAERNQFYADNPDVAEFFAKQDDYERVKRGFLGLPQFDQYPKASDQIQGFMNEYNALPKESKSAWIKANQDKWDAITEQWTLQDIHRLQKEGALAVYEGIDLSEKGIKSILDIARSLGYTPGAGFGTGVNRSQAFLEAISLLRQIETGIRPLSIVSAAPKRARLARVKVPTTRRTARIRLR